MAEVSVVGTVTDYDKRPPPGGGLLTVTIHLRGSDGRDSGEAVYHFSSDRPAAVYDISGAIATAEAWHRRLDRRPNSVAPDLSRMRVLST